MDEGEKWQKTEQVFHKEWIRKREELYTMVKTQEKKGIRTVNTVDEE